MPPMKTLRARVLNRRLVLDEPRNSRTDVLDLTVVDDGDELDEEERMALHAALASSWASAQAGKTRPAEEILQKLKERR